MSDYEKFYWWVRGYVAGSDRMHSKDRERIQKELDAVITTTVWVDSDDHNNFGNG